MFDADGGFGDTIYDDATGEPLTYEDYIYDLYVVDNQEVEDAEFLGSDHEWLAKTRAVRFNTFSQSDDGPDSTGGVV